MILILLFTSRGTSTLKGKMAILRGCLGSLRYIDSLSKATCDLRSGESFVKYLVMLVSEWAKHGIDLTRLLVFSFQRLRLHDDDLSLPQSIAIFEKEVGTYISNKKINCPREKVKEKCLKERVNIYIYNIPSRPCPWAS